jgi:TatD DNase family protein
VSAPGAPRVRRARWIDSHCHLQERYRASGETLSALVDEAASAGVEGIVCVGTDASSSREALSVVETLRNGAGPGGDPFGGWATVGLHPHDAAAGTAELEQMLTEAVSQRPGSVAAVGECGLDYHYDHSPRPVQREVFATQIALAREHDLALVVHSREAWDDTIDILRNVRPPMRTVFHCFTGDADDARVCLDLGAYLSFSGIITFKNASDVRDALKVCPIDRLLVETDAPFLAPAPHRGEPNRPAWVSVVGEAAAHVKSMGEQELAEATVLTTREVFGDQILPTRH